MSDRVRITAADFNGETWDGSPFSDDPNWMLSAIEGGMVRPHTRGGTDYARFDVTTADGVVDAGPGDWIARDADGRLRVERGLAAPGVKNLRARWIGRWDGCGRVLRLVRVMWERGTVGDGRGYSVKLSLGLRPKLFERRSEGHGRGWWLTLAGVRLHYQRAYGGIHV